ncbi:AzlD domain-containing protein [Pseudokineococcus sp. 1T1Z-3]|uniref:AzlD domain-containing protein n=1 Tax=Pseudokineococcus sp. 1T1Z-3 TaxID=3132745 RepID=UPI0030B64F6B
MTPLALLVTVLCVAAGTYALRSAGPWVRRRVALPASFARLVTASAVVLLLVLVVTAGLLDAGTPVGPARPAGVLVGGLLAWRRAPLLLVVLAAAATAALLRLLGVP